VGQPGDLGAALRLGALQFAARRLDAVLVSAAGSDPAVCELAGRRALKRNAHCESYRVFCRSYIRTVEHGLGFF